MAFCIENNNGFGMTFSRVFQQWLHVSPCSKGGIRTSACPPSTYPERSLMQTQIQQWPLCLLLFWGKQLWNHKNGMEVMPLVALVLNMHPLMLPSLPQFYDGILMYQNEITLGNGLPVYQQGKKEPTSPPDPEYRWDGLYTPFLSIYHAC